MWVARNKDNSLTLFLRKPYRREDTDDWWIKPKETERHWDDYDSVIGEWMDIDVSLFPDLKWEDEPIEVFLTMKEIINN